MSQPISSSDAGNRTSKMKVATQSLNVPMWRSLVMLKQLFGWDGRDKSLGERM